MNAFPRARVLAVCAVVVATMSACTYTARMSVDDHGVQGNSHVETSNPAAISADGRYVAFASSATNLVANDTNGWQDIFLRDTVAGTTRRINVSSSGAQATGGDSRRPAISADGKYVAYLSAASNLVTGDTNVWWDAFLYSVASGTTTRVDVTDAGAQGSSTNSSTPAISATGRFVAFSSTFAGFVPNDTVSEDVFVRDTTTNTTSKVSVSATGSTATQGAEPAMSSDGRYVAFNSGATTMVAGDTNGVTDVFVRDRTNNSTSRVSLTSAGAEQSGGTGGSSAPHISADGRFVVFQSLATNLFSNDTNGMRDLFVRDRNQGTTTRVNVSSSGVAPNGDAQCLDTSISADGRYIAFDSNADNLVAADTNHSPDVFVRDRIANTTTRVDLDQAGAQSVGGFSGCPVISADGRYVAFLSIASSLVADDTNHFWDVFVRANPVVSVTSATPGSVARGTTRTISVIGMNFLTGVSVVAPDGITVTSVNRVSETRVDVTIAVGSSSATGSRQLGIYNPGTGQGPLTGSLAGLTITVT